MKCNGHYILKQFDNIWNMFDVASLVWDNFVFIQVQNSVLTLIFYNKQNVRVSIYLLWSFATALMSPSSFNLTVSLLWNNSYTRNSCCRKSSAIAFFLTIRLELSIMKKSQILRAPKVVLFWFRVTWKRQCLSFYEGWLLRELCLNVSFWLKNFMFAFYRNIIFSQLKQVAT